jgi:putative Mg2+ transporter-C (MgtC) family protein
MEFASPQSAGFWLPIAVAIVCGSIIGTERQLRGKPAGVRTSILICLGTEMFVRLGVAFAGEHSDSTRVLGQITTGVGFLGAGVILAREGVVLGVTTAAVIWVLAAIGAAIGFGAYAAALSYAVAVVGILLGVEFLERSARSLQRGVHRRNEGESSEG